MTASFMKIWVLLMSVRFVFLMVAELSDAAPACREVLPRWDCAYVSLTVTSHAIGLLLAHGTNDAPSGRLAFVRDRP